MGQSPFVRLAAVRFPLPVLGLIIACCGFSPTGLAGADSPEAAPVGEWGGPHVRMIISDAGATLEFDCAIGRIDVPVRPGPNGAFDVPGVVMLEAGGPVAPDQPPPPPKAARYAGWTDGEEMRLTVTVTGDGGWELGTFSLGYGRRAALDKCL